MRRDENKNEIETDTDDDELFSESDETISTRNISTSSAELFFEWLPKKYFKFFFLLINSIILLTGVMAIIIAIWMLTDANFTSRLLSQELFIIILLILGVYVSLVAFTGIIGMIKEKDNIMLCYLICQSIALCAIFICLTMSFPFFDLIAKKIRNDMVYSMEYYQHLESAMIGFDNTHKYLKCCGIKSPKDWLDHHMSIPQSCCSDVQFEECMKQMREEVSYKSGCLKGSYMVVKSYIQSAAISMLVIFPLMLIGALLAFDLRKRLRKRLITELITEEVIYS
ncbi:PREDICTED: tetraspanin-6-like [Trachymyrmex septentrionalis]|uniref:tetraspanin-6-like n=1 Tax=Trachymyrmex septentrionalis TaxID=34720 RepID=UPI00084F148E|nr:PREDICTED: tetraspanin-6-like [Trachymyrmex septentrionalis]